MGGFRAAAGPGVASPRRRRQGPPAHRRRHSIRRERDVLWPTAYLESAVLQRCEPDVTHRPLRESLGWLYGRQSVPRPVSAAEQESTFPDGRTLYRPANRHETYFHGAVERYLPASITGQLDALRQLHREQDHARVAAAGYQPGSLHSGHL